MIVPNRVKELRESRSLTQKELGKLIDKDHTVVNKHENHQRPLTKDDAQAYARVFKVETVELYRELDAAGNIV